MYIIKETLSTIKHIELVQKKDFIAVIFYLEDETFVVHVASIVSLKPTHLFQRAQLVSLKANEALIIVVLKYTDFANIFSPVLAAELPEYTGINEYVIKLLDG